jgi:hypothetical protein
LAVAALSSGRAAFQQAAHGGDGDVGDHHQAHGGACLHVLAHVAPPARFACRAVDRHALAVDIDVPGRDGDGLFPAQAPSITHSGSPLALSLDCTNRSPLDASKSRTGSTAPAANAPHANTWLNSTGIGPCSAT